MQFDLVTDGTRECTRIVSESVPEGPLTWLGVDESDSDISSLYLHSGMLALVIDFYRDELGGYTHLAIHLNTELPLNEQAQSPLDSRILQFPIIRRP